MTDALHVALTNTCTREAESVYDVADVKSLRSGVKRSAQKVRIVSLQNAGKKTNKRKRIINKPYEQTRTFPRRELRG